MKLLFGQWLRHVLVIGLLATPLFVTSDDEDRFQLLKNKLEDELFNFGRRVVELHDSNRCNPDLLGLAAGSNYDGCVSSHPSQTCPGTVSFGGSDLSNEFCQCGFLFDFENTVNILPASIRNGVDGNPTDKRVIESIADTMGLEPFLKQAREDGQEFWAEFGIEPTFKYFASPTGHFRQYPALYETTCGGFDPRLRPWYIAASSGPKNVILVLDISKSMKGDGLAVLKEAAKRVVQTLTIGDRVAIVPFGTEATVIGKNGNELFQATNENIQVLSDYIDDLEANGFTNFYDAFDKAFQVLEDSVQSGSAVDCNTAMLFFTDGELNVPDDSSVDKQSVMNLR
ncbi:MAG: hypothetical protein SGARI_005010 [Bacillariaceae sp.]